MLADSVDPDQIALELYDQGTLSVSHFVKCP